MKHYKCNSQENKQKTNHHHHHHQQQHNKNNRKTTPTRHFTFFLAFPFFSGRGKCSSRNSPKAFTSFFLYPLNSDIWFFSSWNSLVGNIIVKTYQQNIKFNNFFFFSIKRRHLFSIVKKLSSYYLFYFTKQAACFLVFVWSHTFFEI